MKTVAVLITSLLPVLIGCSSDDQSTEKTTWPNDTVREEWEVRRRADSLSIREGKFLSYYESGNKHETGFYLNDQKTGLWTFNYDSPGSPRLMEGNFIEGEMDGIWTFWMDPTHHRYLLGAPDSSVDTANRHQMMYMPDSGTTEPAFVKQESYRMGKPHGTWISWHPNRQMADSMGFIDGRLEGIKVSYHPNGRKSFQAVYSGGEPVGDRLFWNEDGSPIDQ